jgi:hypothetical protein
LDGLAAGNGAAANAPEAKDELNGKVGDVTRGLSFQII